MEVPGGHNNKKNVVLAEFLGCMFMMMALNWSSVNNAVPTSVGFMLTILTQLFGDISGAHFNPAVTFGMLFKEGSENWMRNFTFTIMLIIVQGIGFAFGALVTSGGYSWAPQKDKKIPVGGYHVAQICPSHDCADGGSMMRQVFFSELGCTFLFINFIFMIKKHTPEPSDGTSIQPVKALLIGIVYYLCVTMASGMSGGMLNPAIGMIQSLYQKFANSKMYPDADDVGTVYLVVYMFSPFIGAFFAGLWHKWSHERNLKSAVTAQEGEAEALLSGNGGRKHRRVNPRIERRKQQQEGEGDGNKPTAAERKAMDDERRKAMQAKQAEQKKAAAEKAFADKKAAEEKKKADAEAKAKAAAEKKAADDAKKAEAKRIADEKAAKKKADDEEKARQKKEAADKAAADKKAAAEKAAADKKAAEAKKAEQKKIDDEKKAKAAEEKKAADAKKAEEKKIADAKKAEQKKIDDEKKAKAAEEKKIADAKKAEEKKAADAKKAEENAKKAEEKKAADAKKAEEKKAADAKKAEEKKAKEEKAAKEKATKESKQEDKGGKEQAAAKEQEEEKQQEEEKPDLNKARAPNEPDVKFQIRDVLHNGKQGVSNKYWSFMDKDWSMRVTYDKDQGMPVVFVPYKDIPDVYLMKQVYPGYEEKWISFASKGSQLYCRYDNEEDAMPVKFVEQKQNNNGSYVGLCYKMQNWYGGKPGKWISFEDSSKFLKATFKESDAGIVVLEMSQV